MKTLIFTFCLFALVPFALADEWITTHPSGSDASSGAREKCARLAQSSRARLLVIGFEGLASFSSGSTQRMYRYHAALKERRPAARPGGSMAGFVVNGLMIPLVGRYQEKVEVLAFPFSSQTDAPGSNAEICALEWMRMQGHKLLVVGHSFGGDAAIQLMENLSARGVFTELTVTLDPVPKTGRGRRAIHVTRNTKRWENYYQRGFPPMGSSLPGAAVNARVGAAHVAVPRHELVLRSVFAQVAVIVGR